jgi:hypothetical protein
MGLPYYVIPHLIQPAPDRVGANDEKNVIPVKTGIQT